SSGTRSRRRRTRSLPRRSPEASPARMKRRSGSDTAEANNGDALALGGGNHRRPIKEERPARLDDDDADPGLSRPGDGVRSDGGKIYGERLLWLGRLGEDQRANSVADTALPAVFRHAQQQLVGAADILGGDNAGAGGDDGLAEIEPSDLS